MSFSVGVTSPSSIEKSRGRIEKRLICSKRERSRFTASTISCTRACFCSSVSAARHVRIERHERGHERAPVADHDRVRDLGVRLEVVLEVRGRDVLAARRDEDVLLAVGDRDEAVVVDLGDVARVEPAVGVEHLARRRFVLEIAGEDGRAADQELAVVAEAKLGSGQRRPDGAEAVPVDAD